MIGMFPVICSSCSLGRFIFSIPFSAVSSRSHVQGDRSTTDRRPDPRPDVCAKQSECKEFGSRVGRTLKASQQFSRNSGERRPSHRNDARRNVVQISWAEPDSSQGHHVQQSWCVEEGTPFLVCRRFGRTGCAGCYILEVVRGFNPN